MTPPRCLSPADVRLVFAGRGIDFTGLAAAGAAPAARPMPPAGLPTYPCPLCGVGFLTPAGLARHLARPAAKGGTCYPR